MTKERILLKMTKGRERILAQHDTSLTKLDPLLTGQVQQENRSVKQLELLHVAEERSAGITDSAD
jgi:hypothetical protein